MSEQTIECIVCHKQQEQQIAEGIDVGDYMPICFECLALSRDRVVCMQGMMLILTMN